MTIFIPSRGSYAGDLSVTGQISASAGVIGIDTKPPELEWASADSLTVQARPDQPAVVQHTFQDEKQRIMTAALTWDHSNGVAELGYDEESSNSVRKAATTGVTSVAATRQLTDSGVDFQALGIAAGDEVWVNAGPDAGNYTIASVSGGTITIDEDWAAGGQTSVDYEIWNSRWIHLFLVPSSSDDDICTVVASDNAYNTGPTGYTNYKYLGAMFTQVSVQGYYRFLQVGNQIITTSSRTYYSAASQAAFGWTSLDLSPYVPATARAVRTQTKLDSAASDGFSYWHSGLTGITGYHVQTFGGQGSDSASWLVELVEAQTVYHRLVQVTGTGACPYLETRIKGWVDAA